MLEYALIRDLKSVQPACNGNEFKLNFHFFKPKQKSPENRINSGFQGILGKRKSVFEKTDFWLRGLDLNQRPSGYEPDELPAAPPRDIYLFLRQWLL